MEDNPDLRTFISQLLSDYYEVTTAENGAEAFELLTNGTKLPTCFNHLRYNDAYYGRLSTFRKNKNTVNLRHIPVIMLTARVALDDKLKALRIGVDDYLNKPFNEEELLVRIENLVQNSKIVSA